MGSFRDLFNQAHRAADTDDERGALHHTLGRSPNQAAPGDHQHANDLGADLSISLATTTVPTGLIAMTKVEELFIPQYNERIWKRISESEFQYLPRKLGRFSISGNLVWNVNATGVREFGIMLDVNSGYGYGNNISDLRNTLGGAVKSKNSLAGTIDIDQGWKISPFGRQNSGGNLDVDSGLLSLNFMGFVTTTS